MSQEKTPPNASRPPPPLPPRIPSARSYQTPPEDAGDDVPPPPYDSVFAGQSGNDYISLASNDPRSSSTQSLVPSKSEEHSDKRTLLLIFIHGFMGDETSFQSFPAHVHSLVSALVAETHVVHTKLYPRYRSKKKIDFARDDFSRWLAPHESSTTDVILLGHSMGGLLSAEVVLIPSGFNGQLRHRLVGTVNFDVPFLGMHPGVVKSGLASVFSPAPQPAKPSREPGPSNFASPASGAQEHGYFDDAKTSRSPSLPPGGVGSPLSPDPNYNPAFENDVVLPIRKGWRNAWHFVNKHSDDLTSATKQLIKSHVEFGGTMADYSGLKLRYARLRALEEQNASVRKSVLGASGDPPRVRYVNFYTSSTGRPKKPKSPMASEMSLEQPPTVVESTKEDDDIAQKQGDSTTVENAGSILIINDNEELEEESKSLGDDDDTNRNSMDHIDPAPIAESVGDTSDSDSWTDAIEDHSSRSREPAVKDEAVAESVSTSESAGPKPSTDVSSQPSSTAPSLPPLPELQPKPAPLDLAAYSDKDARKLAEKDYSRAMKAYDKAVKDREKATRDRAKLVEKRERQAIKEGKKAEKEREKSEKQREKEAKKEPKDVQIESKSKETDHEKLLTLERKETEREWREALNQRWNDEDSTVEPRPGLNSSKNSTIRSSQASVRTALANEREREKPMKDRTFCSLPPKDRSGNRDPTWVRVLMEDVDEVGAHCGLFFSDNERYERLVVDVGEKILDWVNEAESERVIKELEAQG